MKLRLFAVEIQKDQKDETIKVSFDTVFAPTDLDWVKDNIGKEVNLEDLQTMEN